MEIYDRRNAPRRADSWFVYGLVDSRAPVEIRYIGITNNPYSRLSMHLSQASKEGWKKSRWIGSVVDAGAEVLMCVLASGMTQDASMMMEVALIAEYRANGASLMNLTDGGDGVKGQVQSAEARAKKSAALKGRIKSPEHIARMAESKRGRTIPDEQRAKMSSSHLRRYEDPAAVERQRVNTILRFDDQAERQRYAEATKQRFNIDGAREEHGIIMRATYDNDPSIVERASLSRRANGRQSNNKSGYKGVFLDNSRGKFVARIHVNGKNKHVGYFMNAEDAARAYDEAILAQVGAGAYVNFPQLPLMAAHSS
jgi:hypothetical protein